ncbi:methylthioribulose 1-phosphate dehydratase [Fluviicola sp.]|jgi:methylthioribulose-1-phosphate dehydratase|uniref:methylthioribulose 1-phosphate dehydratase n=1 Tax=Fluviicola sp. TaxID=1917219 RepID=UPI002833A0F1|nr:methylthioribulose 1-phosphate dehydratase [Fluviicola sp.]MDR0802392.1 methylthioribulose 1-phosphate dehydratase [Fluviicola sp.]
MEELKTQLAQVIRTYHQKGWSPATSTNYSFRNSGNPEVIVVSKSGIDKSVFTAEDFMEVDLQGEALPAYEGIRPSAETLIHCKLYELFPETMCIVHSHSVYSVLQSMKNQTAVELSGYEVLKGFEGIKTHETTVSVPVFNNTQDMPAFSTILEQEKDRLTVPAFIMRQHGVYAWGRNLFEAKRHLETAEYLFEADWKFSRK